jgi:hypothetical protein
MDIVTGESTMASSAKKFFGGILKTKNLDDSASQVSERTGT